MVFINHYKILNIEFNSNQKQIRKAYHKLCLQWHPDKNKCKTATEKFKTIQKSYETLSNLKTKKEYDKIYKKHIKININIKNKSIFKLFPKIFEKIKKINKENISNFIVNLKNEINTGEFKKYINLIKKYYNNINNFDDFNFKEKSLNTNYNLNVNLEDYYNFQEKEFQIPIINKCYLCSNQYNNYCNLCRGNIYYISFKIFNLKLSKKQYILKNQGNLLFGCNKPGDLIINLIDKPNQSFKRRGKFNLLYIENISIENYNKNDYKIEFLHLDNKIYFVIIKDLKNIIDKNIDKKILICLKNYGLPTYQDNNHGNLFILINNNFMNYSKNITDGIKCNKIKILEYDLIIL